jgi:hypothetical protein
MSISRKITGDASGGSGGSGKYVDDVFQTTLTEGLGNETIVNGMDLADKGALIWQKSRIQASPHYLYDSERGAGKALSSNSADSESDFGTSGVQSWNEDGWTAGSGGSSSGNTTANWVFAKQKGFFDVVTYTGQDGHTQPHNLGTVPGMVIVKCTSDTQQPGWIVWHRETGDTGYLVLNETDALNTSSASPRIYNVTDTSFDLGDWAPVSNVGKEYVAYVFAHDAPMFGPDGDESVIKCGSYTGTGAAGNEIDLGWGPQYLLVKSATTPGDSWIIMDTMRGIVAGANGPYLFANTSSVEYINNMNFDVTPTGFVVNTTHESHNGSGHTYIYMAIRRPNKPAEEFEPEELFGVSSATTGRPQFKSGFPVDMAWRRKFNSATETQLSARLISGKHMPTNGTAAAVSSPTRAFDFSNGWYDFDSEDAGIISPMFRRAPGFFDVVCYEGDGQAVHEIPHSLGTQPEMIWIKSIDQTYPWPVYHKDTHTTNTAQNWRLDLSTDGSRNGGSSYFPFATLPDSFPVGSANHVNATGASYIANLFASVPGFCDIGSYTGDGELTMDIDCGFTNGARFVLIKRTDAAGDWMYFDTLRGIDFGISPMLKLNSTDAQSQSSFIEPHPKGFTVTYNRTGIHDATYIYMAIA